MMLSWFGCSVSLGLGITLLCVGMVREWARPGGGRGEYYCCRVILLAAYCYGYSSVVCVCVCCAEMAEPFEMLFQM